MPPSPASSAASRLQNRGWQSTTLAGVPAATGRRMGRRRGRLLGAGEETGRKHLALESLEVKEEEFVGKLWKAGEQRAPGLRPPAGAPACWLLGPGGLHPHGNVVPTVPSCSAAGATPLGVEGPQQVLGKASDWRTLCPSHSLARRQCPRFSL